MSDAMPCLHCEAKPAVVLDFSDVAYFCSVACAAGWALAWCQNNGVAFFMKQKGSSSDIACRDAKGGDPAEWPEWCRVRQFPDGPRLFCA